MALTREDILKARLRTEEIEVPQWDGTVVIGEMPVAKRNELLGHLLDDQGNVKPATADIELALFIAGMHDPPFTAEDAEVLQSVSGAAVSHVAQEIMRLNGFTDDALADARGKS